MSGALSPKLYSSVFGVCLGLVSRNNEIEVAWHNWGWQQKYNIHGADSARMWQAYLTLFDTLIPEALGVWSGSVPYTRSSPIGNWGNLQQMKRGDNHDWGNPPARVSLTEYIG